MNKLVAVLLTVVVLFSTIQLAAIGVKNNRNEQITIMYSIDKKQKEIKIIEIKRYPMENHIIINNTEFKEKFHNTFVFGDYRFEKSSSGGLFYKNGKRVGTFIKIK